MQKFLNKKVKAYPDLKASKKPYPPTVVIKEIPVSGPIRAQLVGNSLGNFIDLRYFSGNTPTKKGIRIHIKSFVTAMKKLQDELERLAKEDDD